MDSDLYGTPSIPANRRAPDDDSGIATDEWLASVGVYSCIGGVFTKRQVAAIKGLSLEDLEAGNRWTN